MTINKEYLLDKYALFIILITFNGSTEEMKTKGLKSKNSSQISHPCLFET